jgi:hypothetical protein
MLGFHSHEGTVGGRKVFTFLDVRGQVPEINWVERKMGATEGVGSLRSLGLATEKDCGAWFAKAHCLSTNTNEYKRIGGRGSLKLTFCPRMNTNRSAAELDEVNEQEWAR